jgi:hypothetical protein
MLGARFLAAALIERCSACSSQFAILLWVLGLAAPFRAAADISMLPSIPLLAIALPVTLWYLKN